MDVRRAGPDDAAGIVAILDVIAAERVHSAIDQVWSIDEERRYICSLSATEAIHLAVDGAMQASGRSAAALVSTSTRELLDIATAAMPSR